MCSSILRNLSGFLVALIVVTACSSLEDDGPVAPLQPEKGTLEVIADREGYRENGAPWTAELRIELDERAEATSSEARDLTHASVRTLTEAEAAALFQNVPELTSRHSPSTDLSLPIARRIPPPIGGVEAVAFPPEEQLEAPKDLAEHRTLQVVRYSPAQDVDRAAGISLTFSLPMVPLSSQAQLAEMELPITMTPEVPGTWSWVGTRTLSFKAEGKLPGATTYRIEVPVGLQSIGKESLEFPFQWEFSTAPLALSRSFPGAERQPLRPFVALEFNQAIDSTQLKPFLSVQSGGREMEFAVIKPGLFDLPTELERFLDSAHPDRTVVLQPLQEAASNTTVTVEISAGAPSAEGPLPSLASQLVSFRTIGGLRLENQSCAVTGRHAYDCEPGEPFYLAFNNPLVVDSVSEDQLDISPPLSDGKLYVSPWGDITIFGSTSANTIYTLTWRPGPRDVYGQTFSTVQEIQFSVGEANPWLQDPGVMKLLPSSSEGFYPLFSRNLEKVRVQVYSADPGNWYDFSKIRDGLFQFPWSEQQLFGSAPLFSDWIPLESSNSEVTRYDLDLNPYLEDGKGHLVLFLTPSRSLFDWENFVETSAVWIQATDINLDAYADEDLLVVRASNLNSGVPKSGVNLTLHPLGEQRTTFGDGHTTFDLYEEGIKSAQPAYIKAQLGLDTAFLPRSYHYSSSSFWRNYDSTVRLNFHLFTDRHLYKPREEVHVKGWLRQIDMAPTGDVEFSGKANRLLKYSVMDSRGIEIEAGTVKLNEREAIDFAFQIPADANSGYGRICLQNTVQWDDGKGGSNLACMGFQIQEFRRPEFALALKRNGGPEFMDTNVSLELQANYYGGGPLASSEVTWQVSGYPTHFAPPGWEEYSFGGDIFEPWYPFRFDNVGNESDGGSGAMLDGTLSVQGLHSIDIKPTVIGSPVTYMLQANATVKDLSQQTQSTSDQFLVHPSNQYVGAKTRSYLFTQNKAEIISLVVVDVAGKVVSGQEIIVQGALRQSSGYATLPLGRELQEEVACTVISTEQPVYCEVDLAEPGLWDFRISTLDSSGRENVTLLQRYVVGKGLPPSLETGRSEVKLVADRDNYEIGDTARILLQAPFLPAYGTVLTNRGGILNHESVEITESQHFLEIPIDESAYLPNLTVSVYLTGIAAGTDGSNQSHLAAAQGSVDLSIPPVSRELTLELKLPTAVLAPGETAEIEVVVKDPEGNPVPDAEVVLLAVDESILSLAGYMYNNPIETFYPHRYRRLSSYQLFDHLLQSRNDGTEHLVAELGMGGGAMDMLEMAAPAAMAMADTDSAETSSRDMASQSEKTGIEAPLARLDFNPLAVFRPTGATDSEGRFAASWKLPDLVGQYRIVAMATSGPRFYGLGEAALVARLPLQIRPQLPRFLNYGDIAQLQFVVENQTLSDQTVTLFLQSYGLELAYQEDGLNFDAVLMTVPAQSRQLVARPANAAFTGTQQLIVSAFNGQLQDHVQLEFPVFTPAAKEGFATYGIVEDELVLQTFKWPTDIHSDFGGLSVSVSSTLLNSLADGYLDTFTNQWLSTEALASRIMASAALREVIPVFSLPDLPSVQEIDGMVQANILQVQEYQNPDGGFPLWPRKASYAESWPFASVYVLHALIEARAAGYEVSDQVLTNGLSYLADIRSMFPNYYSQSTRDLIEAYALYARALQKDVDIQAALRIVSSRDWQLQSGEALAWVIQVLSMSTGNEEKVLDIWGFLLDRVDETAGKANFATGYREEEGHLILSSDKRTGAIMLQALIRTRPETDLMPKLVAGLLADRRRGHWGSTQSNVFVILAMRDYFRRFENIQPDFKGRAWLDETLIYDESFAGRSLATKQAFLPNTWLAVEQPEKILLQREGVGRMYYRLGLEYVPTDLLLDPVERGFTVLRTYKGLDDPADVWQGENGVWHIRWGARVGIDVTLVAIGPRYHVSLTSPLPAGLELINTVLRGVSPPSDPFASSKTLYYGPWYDHQQLLDERAQAVATYLPGGVYEYHLEARATSSGTFVVPPATALEQYAPETFGHTATDRVVVVASE